MQLRHVDAGSCNGCELEIASAFGPVYDAGRFGARLVASPRHADGVLVTGVVTRNMAVPLDKTLDAVPRPRVVVACGDCALGGGLFAGGYGVADSAGPLSAPDVAIPGCPPGPGRHHPGAARADRPVSAALFLGGLGLGAAGSLAGGVLPARVRVPAASVLTAAGCAAAFAAAARVLVSGEAVTAHSAEILPLTGVTLSLDPLGAVFVITAAVAGAAASCYNIGYAATVAGAGRRPRCCRCSSRACWPCRPRRASRRSWPPGS